MHKSFRTKIRRLALAAVTCLAALACGAEPGVLDIGGHDPILPAPSKPASNAANISLIAGHDVVEPVEPDVLPLVSQVPAPDGSLVSYTGITGGVYSLRQFNGLYTLLLVPDSVVDELGIARIRQIVDEHDIVYLAYKEMMNGDQGIAKPLSIAIVPTSCGGGCFGGKIEILDGIFQTPGYFDWVTHEMGHAFDPYSSHLFVAGDIPHSWTWFWEMYIRVYLRKTHFEILPTLDLASGFTTDEFYDYRVRERFTNLYEVFPNHSWTACILNQTCDPPGDPSAVDMSTTAQGGVILRVAQLHGVAPMKTWISKVQTLIAQRGYDPATMSNQDHIDLLVESLSQAVNTNLACYFNTTGSWNWPISSAALARLNALPANPLCNDSDGDTFRRYQRDCNDSNAAIKPNATETSNSTDDNCNGVVDDLLTSETTDYSNSASTPKVVGFPARINGTIGTATDQDHFRINLTSATTVQFTLRSPTTFIGTLTILQQGSTTNEYTHWDVPAGGLQSIKVNLAAGNWNFFLSNQIATGGYELLVQASTNVPMALDFWPASFTPSGGAVASGGPNRYSLPVPATPSSLVGTPNLSAHYWVSNFGLVGSVPAGSSTPFVWTAPSDTDPRKITYRVQFRNNVSPVYQTSQQVGLLGPRPWSSQNVGSVGIAGSSSNFSEADLAVRGSGADIGGTSDAFRFTSTPLSGDGEVVAQVLGLTNTNPSAKAGVMIRESLAANSTHAMMVFTPSGLSFQRRTSTGGTTSITSGGGAAPPAWVKVVRLGSTFKGYSSTDGVHWSSVGSATITMASSAFAGVVVTSHDNAQLATGNFDRVGVGPTPSALFVTNSTTLGTGDTAVRNRLENLGYNVVVKAAPTTSGADATGKALVVISSSVASGDVNTKFRTVTSPVFTWESSIFDDMGMTGTVSGTDFGTQTGQTQVNVVNASHPMAAGLSGLVAASASGTFSWGVPNANAARIATLSGNPSRYTMFGYDVGAAMPGLAAPARRVGFFLEDTTAASLTTNGWSLFDASIRWATVR